MHPEKRYPRTGDRETVYLKQVITNPNIRVGDFTMYHDFIHDPRQFEQNAVRYHYPLNHDVWIGYEAILLAGVTIGDGAVIGTRALVTKDVPPYTIVGGTPARVLRKRFSEDTISALLRLKWWDWPIEHIQRYIPEIQSGQVHPLLSAHPE